MQIHNCYKNKTTKENNVRRIVIWTSSHVSAWETVADSNYIFIPTNVNFFGFRLSVQKGIWSEFFEIFGQPILLRTVWWSLELVKMIAKFVCNYVNSTWLDPFGRSNECKRNETIEQPAKSVCELWLIVANVQCIPAMLVRKLAQRQRQH